MMVEGMIGMWNFIRSWAVTLRIMILERETYRFLRDLEFNEDDFVEVGPPVCPDCMRDNEPNGLDTWDF